MMGARAPHNYFNDARAGVADFIELHGLKSNDLKYLKYQVLLVSG